VSAIFISHSGRDNAIAVQVKSWLIELGHRSLFLDFDPEVGIPAGRNWESELYAHLRACQAVIVLCSDHSMASKWCFAEVTQARAAGKHLFPLKVAPTEILPILSDVQVIDFTANVAEARKRLAHGLREAGMDPGDLFDWDGSRPPYPGLMAFEGKDAAVYFGRDAEIQKTLETLNRLRVTNAKRLTLLLGASGAGKSSLVRAGVLPRLERSAEGQWIVVPAFRPFGRPFKELANALTELGERAGARLDCTVLHDAFTSNDPLLAAQRFSPIIDTLRVGLQRRDASLLVTVDQFEELLVGEMDAVSAAFLGFVRGLTTQGTDRVFVLATMRSDFLGLFQTLASGSDLPYEPLTLEPMRVAQFGEVIEKPAAVAGLTLESGLVQAMVQDTATPDALPLLAFALGELWKGYRERGFTLHAYRDFLGGLQGAVAKRADTIFAGIAKDRVPPLRTAFLSLVRVTDEGAYLRRQARWTDLPLEVHSILDQFVAARLLVSYGDGTDRKVEIAHEALIRYWGTLKGWLDEDQAFLIWRERLSRRVAEWQRSNEEVGELLQGALLLEAERRQTETPDLLEPSERHYISQSIAQREKERHKKQVDEQARQTIEEADAVGRRSLQSLGGFIGALIILIFAGMQLMGLPTLGPVLFDLWQRMSPRQIQSMPATVVEIDDKSMAAFGQWPWPRTQLAQLVNTIAQEKPMAIALDIIMPEADALSPEQVLARTPHQSPALASAFRGLPSNDTELAHALAAAHAILAIAGTAEPTGMALRTPTFSVRDSAASSAPATRVTPKLAQYAGVQTSIDELDRAAAGRGLISVAPGDGVIRRIPLVASINWTLVPALAVEMLRVALHAPSLGLLVSGASVRSIVIGDFVVPTESDGAVRVYYSRRDDRRIVSAIDVLEGKVDPSRLQQKFVLIGVKALGLADYQNTPIGELMPGSEIHAQLLENLYDQTLLRRPTWGPAVELALTLLVGAAMLWVFFRASPLAGIIIAAGTIAILLITSFVAFRASLLLLDVTLAVGIVLVLVAQQSMTLLQRARRQGQLVRIAADHGAQGRPENGAFYS
jgi:CHASE2 domain-containing sensor protein